LLLRFLKLVNWWTSRRQCQCHGGGRESDKRNLSLEEV
jgi:hypothetical protein